MNTKSLEDMIYGFLLFCTFLILLEYWPHFHIHLLT